MKLNKKGFSIVEVLIAFGLIFMLVMQVSQFSSTANQLKISLRFQSQINMLTRGFKQNLLDPDACLNTLNPVGTLSTGTPIPSLRDADNAITITFPYVLGTARALAPVVAQISGPSPNVNIQVKFDYQLVVGGGSMQTVSKFMDFAAVVNGSNVVQSCSLVEANVLANSFISLKRNDFKEFNLYLENNLIVGGASGLKLDESLPAVGSPHVRLFNLDAASDKNLKENIAVISDFKEKFQQLEVIEFNYLNSSEKTVGLNATQIKKLFPNAIREKDGNLFVNYFYFIPYIWEYTKDLKARQARLKNWVKNENAK